MTTIAITGPTGNFGHGLIPLLETDPRVKRIIGVARRPFDPATLGWSKLEYRQGDVRDRTALTDAFAGAGAVAHLAFAKFGHDSHEALQAINVEGTMNAFHAAAEAGARCFVFASSIAAYGLRADAPSPITEDWPAHGSERWFYSREKAHLEELLQQAAAEHPDVRLTIFRPGIVVGPQTAATIGDIVPPALRPLTRMMRRPLAALPWPQCPQPLQFVHESDVGEAFRLALLGGPAGTYNLAGDGVVDGAQVTRELGHTPLPMSGAALRTTARALTHVPMRPAALETADAATRPLIIDSSKAKRELGWQPRYTSIAALRATVES